MGKLSRRSPQPQGIAESRRDCGGLARRRSSQSCCHRRATVRTEFVEFAHFGWGAPRCANQRYMPTLEYAFRVVLRPYRVAKFGSLSAYLTQFGTRGSQVQILSPRPICCRGFAGFFSRAAAFVLAGVRARPCLARSGLKNVEGELPGHSGPFQDAQRPTHEVPVHHPCCRWLQQQPDRLQAGFSRPVPATRWRRRDGHTKS